MIDHVSVMVSDFAKSRAFYLQALAQTGHSKLVELPAAPDGHAQTAGFCHADGSDLWIRQGDPNRPPIHLAFRVPSRLGETRRLGSVDYERQTAVRGSSSSGAT